MSGSKAARSIALTATLTLVACSIVGSFHLSASNLDVGPDPAVPGDSVLASFIIRIAPVQRHTVVFTIDGIEHLRLSSSDAPPFISTLTLGDASTLIATYGIGTHSARVQVHAEEDNESARTESVTFELRDTVP